MHIKGALNRIRRMASLHSWEDHSIDIWDREYSTAFWSYLGGLEQMPRYAVIEGWRHRLKPTGRVLDLGCGEGVLLEQIHGTAAVDYTGVDFSQVAIDVAVTKIRDASIQRFVCADLVTFEPPPGAAFDVIVFNEVLYYLADPRAVVRRYRTSLAPGGLMIVSIFHDNVGTWNAVSTMLADQCLQTTVVRDGSSGKRWHLGLYGDRSSLGTRGGPLASS